MLVCCKVVTRLSTTLLEPVVCYKVVYTALWLSCKVVTRLFFSVWVITVTLPNVTPIMATPTPEGQFGEDLAMLTSLARERGFTLKDVPRDGNCLFSAVQLQRSIFETAAGVVL